MSKELPKTTRSKTTRSDWVASFGSFLRSIKKEPHFKPEDLTWIYLEFQKKLEEKLGKYGPKAIYKAEFEEYETLCRGFWDEDADPSQEDLERYRELAEKFEMDDHNKLEEPEEKEEKYVNVKDDEGHWYHIPENLIADFGEYCDLSLICWEVGANPPPESIKEFNRMNSVFNPMMTGGGPIE